ncbi:hypothetical protein H0H93_006383 [Arthromyces matolae]|nr:hypothetical protein H0H93_006383 [Arthromyces matolae]
MIRIDDPYTISVISSCEVSLEEDGSLDTTRIGFVNDGDSFVGYPDPKDGRAYNPLIDRSLPSTISPTKLRKSLRLINGAPALPLIRLSDYDKALTRQIKQQREIVKSKLTSIVPPHEVKRPVEAAKYAPSRSHLLPRRLTNPDNPDARDEPLDIA